MSAEPGCIYTIGHSNHKEDRFLEILRKDS